MRRTARTGLRGQPLSTDTTTSKEIQYQIPPGRQAVYVAGVAQKSQTGNVQVNYGSRQYGHFIVRPAPCGLMGGLVVG